MFWTAPSLLAHGALGPFDEILLILVIGLFVVMFAAPTVIALVRRGRGDVAEADEPARPTEAPEGAESARPPASGLPAEKRRDHYRLD